MTNKLSLKPGQTLPMEEKLVRLMDLRDMMERGYMSLSKIAEIHGISRTAAMVWRKEALLLAEKDSNGYTREGIRNIQIGRIQYMIERLQNDLDLTDNAKDRAMLHDRIVKYYDALARITGLNSEQVQHTHELKPLQIVRATPIDIDNK